ncbi:hypothetical protein HDU90_002335 [Geranomyces variabilis]|nr:hypothetical protein HDU90_002335 [Geranomyces variabilis]
MDLASSAFRAALGLNNYATVLHPEFNDLHNRIPNLVDPKSLLWYSLHFALPNPGYPWRTSYLTFRQGPAVYPRVRADPAVDDAELGASAFFFHIYDKVTPWTVIGIHDLK